MKKKLYIIFLLKLILIFSFNDELLAKKTDKYYKSSNISSYFYGILSFQDNNFSSAFSNFRKLKGLENYHSNYAKFYQNTLINLEKFDEAYRFSKNLEKQQNDNFESNLLIGVYHLKNKDYKEASRYFKKIENLFIDESITGFLSLSLNNWISFNDISYEEATIKINNLNERFKKIKKIQHVFANCFYDKKNTNKKFNELISKNDDLVRYNFFYITYLYKNNNIKKAKKILNDKINLYPESLILGQLNEDIENSQKTYFSDNFECKNKSHVIAEIIYIISNALSSQGLYSLSNFYLNIAKYLNENFTSYQILYGENHYQLENFNDTKKIFRKISNNGKIYDWYASKQITNTMLREKKTEEAIIYLEKKYKKLQKPGIFQIYDYADFLKRNEKYNQSLKYFDLILNRIDTNHKLYAKATDKRGVVNERLGNWDNAEKDFLNSLKISPDQAYVINYLAYSWLEQSKNIEKSLEMLKKANDLKNNDGYIIDSLGWAHFKLKNYSKAKFYLQKAIKIMPDDPVINDHYGDTLWMSDKKLQARYYWKNVLNLDGTEDELVKKVKKKLIYGLEIIQND